MAPLNDKWGSEQREGCQTGPPDPTQLFQTVRDSFLRDLDGKERFQKYTDPESMLKEINQEARGHPQNKSRVMLCARKMNSLVEKLAPYFDVVNIFVQSNPTYCALVWGSLTILFRLTNQYVTFLDKVCEMLDRITATIPAYDDYLHIVREWFQRDGASISSRIPEALSRVYRDILEFCYYTCKLLSHGDKGIRARWSLFRQSAWKPWDTHFSGILRSLRHHSEIFEREVNCFSTIETLQFIATYNDRIQKEEAENLDNAKNIMDEQAERILRWINSPNWIASFEHAQKRRLDGTCEWIHEDPVYQQWWSRLQDSKMSLAERILLIQGKPGYGKTIICTRLIDNLISLVLTPPPPKRPRDDSHETQKAEYQEEIKTGNGKEVATSSDAMFCFAFFFFDKQRNEMAANGNAMRAFLSQIIHANRYHGKVLDLAAFFLAKNPNGLETATDNQVLDLLQLLLQNLPSVLLIADGVDECFDHRQFVDDITKAMDGSQNCGLVLLSRPTIEPHPKLGSDCSRISLGHGQNQSDIKLYLRKRVRDLFDEGTLDTGYDQHTIVQKIVSRADGMFMWVFLLMEYLNCPALTVKQRLEAIENLNRLEGLDNLYAAIFKGLEQQFPRAVGLNIKRVFQWVAFSLRPLGSRELEICASIPTDRPPGAGDQIPNIKKNLARLSGAMLEISPDDHIRFIHLSTKEFFSGYGAGFEEESPLLDLIDPIKTNRYMALCCVSYLLYMVPGEPFGVPSKPESARELRVNYQFLDYAAQFWSNHLGVAMCTTNFAGEDDRDRAGSEAYRLCGLAQDFLSKRQQISMWIEASLLYGHFPNIAISHWMQNAPSTMTDLTQLRCDIIDLHHDLGMLSFSWRSMLQEEPHEIWEPSVPGFTRSRFWGGESTTQVHFLAPDKIPSSNYMVLLSQTSPNGREVGVLKLFHPRLPIEKNSKYVPWFSSAGEDSWAGLYEVWCLSTGKVVHALPTSLSAHSICLFESKNLNPWDFEHRPILHEKNKMEKDDGWGIKIQAAISGDLCTAIIGDKAIRIAREADNIGGASIHHQTLPGRPARILAPFRADLEYSQEHYETHSHAKISANGEYLVTVHKSHAKVIKDEQECSTMWLLQVLRDKEKTSAQGLGFTLVTSTVFFADLDTSLLSPMRGVEFHPSKPILFFPQVINGLSQTYLWEFEFPVDIVQYPENPMNPRPLFHPTLIDIQFSIDGRFVSGTALNSEFGISESFASWESRDSWMDTDSSLNGTRSILQGVDNVVSDVSCSNVPLSLDTLHKIAHKEKPVVQNQDSLIVSNLPDDQLELSKLITSEMKSAAILHTFNSSGEWKTETLTRLPKEINGRLSVDLISTCRDNPAGTMRLVLNKRIQKSYSRSDLNNTLLPAILDRAWSTVPVHTKRLDVASRKLPYLLPSSSTDNGRGEIVLSDLDSFASRPILRFSSTQKPRFEHNAGASSSKSR